MHWVEVVAIMTRHCRSQSHPTPPPSARCQSSPPRKYVCRAVRVQQWLKRLPAASEKFSTECRDDVKHFYCNVIKLGWILQQLAAVVCLDLLWIFTEHEWELHGGCCRQSVCFVLQPLVRIHGRLCKQYKMLPKSPLPQNQDNWCWNKLSPKRQWHRVAVAAVHFIRIIV